MNKSSKPIPMSAMYELCEHCSTGYISANGTRPCPFCEVNFEVQILRRSLSAANLQTEQLRRQMDSISAMRDCLDLLEAADVLQVKQVLYAFRENPKKVVIAVAYKVQTDSVSGFVVQERFTNPNSKLPMARVEEYEMVSMGGVALATEYETAARMYKTTQASAMLLRAAGHLLEVNSS